MSLIIDIIKTERLKYCSSEEQDGNEVKNGQGELLKESMPYLDKQDFTVCTALKARLRNGTNHLQEKHFFDTPLKLFTTAKLEKLSTEKL